MMYGIISLIQGFVWYLLTGRLQEAFIISSIVSIGMIIWEVNDIKSTIQKQLSDVWGMYIYSGSYDSYTVVDLENMIVDVKSDARPKSNLSDSQVKIRKLEGDFSSLFALSYNPITTLKNCPIIVTGDFDVYNQNLTSLEGCPRVIGGRFICFNNKLTSLVFAPRIPDRYDGNPCADIYYTLGFTTEAHIESLINLDPDWRETVEKLKVQFPERYEELLTAKKLRLELGLEEKELREVYNTVKNIESAYF